MIRPPRPAWIIARPAARDSQNAPLRFTSSAWRQASSSNSSALASGSTAARLTTTSTPPSSAAAFAISSSALSGSPMSIRSPTALGRPAASSLALSWLRPAIASEAPSSANSSEVILPMPP